MQRHGATFSGCTPLALVTFMNAIALASFPRVLGDWDSALLHQRITPGHRRHWERAF